MMEKIMAVYDVDPVYAARFADVANAKERVPFTVIPFSTLERLREYAETHRIEILLISVSVLPEQIKGIRAGTVVTLAEGEVVSTVDSYPSVYKYQSADSVIREVMTYYCQRPEQNPMVLLGRKAKVLGVYSPLGRCLKTSLALTMGQQLAREGKTLYVGLEEFSGFSRIIDGQCKSDFSDVLYYLHQDGLHVMRLRSLVYNWKDMDYIPPVKYPEDLEGMSGEEAGQLIECLAAQMGYEYVIVDMGRLGRNLIPILQQCEIVFMPIKEDGISTAKLEEFDEYLDITGHQDIREKIRKVKLPYHSSFGKRESYMENLLWGELGDYVRQILKGLPWR